MAHFLDQFVANPEVSSKSEETPDKSQIKSDEEGHFLHQFGPERKPSSETKETKLNELESGAIGAAQGASLNFGDEGLAAFKSIVEGPSRVSRKFADSDDRSLSNLAKIALEEHENNYVDTRDKLRDLVKKAKDQNPNSYLTGEVAGGFAAPGLGVAGNALKATKALSPVARLAARIGLGAASGGAIGGASALGASNATTPEEATEDALQGASTGAMIGGAIPVGTGIAGGAARYAGNKILDLSEATGLGKLLTKPFAKGLEGVNLGMKAQDEASGDFAKGLGNDLVGLKKSISGEYDKFINEAQENGVTVDLKDTAQKILDNAKELMPNASPEEQAEIGKIVSKVKNYINLPEESAIPEALSSTGGLTSQPEAAGLDPRTAKELETHLGDLAMNNRKGFAGQADKMVSNDIAEQIPSISDTNAKYAQMSNAFDSLGVKKNLRQVPYGQESSIPSDKFSKLLALVQNQGSEGSRAGQVARDRLNNASDAFGDVAPELADKIQNELPEVSENYNLAKQINGTHVGGHGWLGALAGGVNKFAGKTGNYAGRTLNESQDAIGDVANRGMLSAIAERTQPKELSQATYSLSNDDLQGLVNTLGSNEATQGQAQALQNALQTKNDVSKNALLFNLLQKKDGRDILRGFIK